MTDFRTSIEKASAFASWWFHVAYEVGNCRGIGVCCTRLVRRRILNQVHITMFQFYENASSSCILTFEFFVKIFGSLVTYGIRKSYVSTCQQIVVSWPLRLLCLGFGAKIKKKLKIRNRKSNGSKPQIQSNGQK